MCLRGGACGLGADRQPMAGSAALVPDTASTGGEGVMEWLSRNTRCKGGGVADHRRQTWHTILFELLPENLTRHNAPPTPMSKSKSSPAPRGQNPTRYADLPDRCILVSLNF